KASATRDETGLRRPVASRRSKGAALTERDEGWRLSDDDVVDDPDSHDLPRLRHAAGEGEILGTGRGIAARVVVEQEDAGGVREQRGGQDAARLDGGAGQRELGDELLARVRLRPERRGVVLVEARPGEPL